MNMIFRVIASLIIVFVTMPIFALAQVAVIVHKSNAINNVSTAEMKNIYTGDMTKFASGSNITIVTYKSDTDSRKKFYGAIGKKYTECQSAILKRMMNDGLKPPVAFDNEDDVLAFVAKTPGAIGFVSSSAVNSSVKVIAIDGKKQLD